MSWTEKEYDYAVEKGIPVIAFDHKDFTKLPANQTDLDDKKREKLIAFKKKVSNGRMIAKWSNADNLALAVSKSLKQNFELKPRTGWVKAGTDSGDAQEEIERLKKEIADREDELKRLTTRIAGLQKDLTKKTQDYNALEVQYQAAQQEIKQHQEKIKALEAKLKKYKFQPLTETFTVEGVPFNMIHVEGGTFTMGADENDEAAMPDEYPAHEVTLSDYWMGETQVTQELWKAVMGYNPSRFNDNPNHPVEHVSSVDCKEFIRRLNDLTGKEFRLPTEAQWEFAARGGNPGKENRYRYAGSNDIFEVAWFKENSTGSTHPVGELEPNELKLYDMSGNVLEWCADSYRYYRENSQTNPIALIGSLLRVVCVVRGGSWYGDARFCRVSNRSSRTKEGTEDFLGLRLAL